MKLRTVALALALSCGFTALGEAKQKPRVTRVKTRKAKTFKVKRLKPAKQKVVKHRTNKR
jgi:hypothetical protein